MDRVQLYSELAERKSKPKDFLPYQGDNGRVNKCAELVKNGKLKKGGTLLDVGGGIGDLGYALREEFDQKFVLDISSKNIDAAYAKENTQCFVADVDITGLRPINGGSVDLITALDFIEHIIDPENFARECYRVLKPGGEVFINTPNIQYWEHIETLTNGRMPHTSGDREVYHGGHLAFFTFLDLCEIFGKAKFGGFEQFKDDECYRDPPRWIFERLPFVKTQHEYVQSCMRFGNPNLLFKAVKSQ